ncbi:MAG: O-antigen ligase family protein [Acidobacteria bacterium]|nr:O-antigen ligase family protein [Acidobacteriota bacterium]
MQNFLEKLDDLADIKNENALARMLERVAFIFMILMFVSAPHSIAATQIAWLTGMFAWFIRLFLKPRPRLVRTLLDVPLWIFFGWSVLSSVFSYDPLTSLDKLRNVALFLIFYYIVNVVRTKRAVVFLAFAMILSTMVSVVWTPIERIFGRGVEIIGVSAESPFTKALLINGDTLLKANGKKLKTPDDLLAEIQANELTKVDFYRPDFYYSVELRRENLLSGTSSLEKLGIADWKKSRNWRSAGFYGHYMTFAEVLQLIASLTFGLFIASLGGKFLTQKRWRGAEESQSAVSSQQSAENTVNKGQKTKDKRRWTLILGICLIGMAFALLLTVTRASQLAFLVSAFAIVLANGSRKMLLTLAAVILPVVLIGLIFLQQSRQVGFFDSSDASTTWRETVYREGFDLWTDNPRNFFLGVGMDSIKKYAKEWHLFDDGRLPMGHFHSTPLQLLVERGLPALLLWLWVLWIYARTLLRHSRFQNSNPKSQIPNPKLDNWRERGIILGSFGGLIGFFTSGLVHFNLGDAEVAMVFFMLMGLSISLVIQVSRFEIQDKFAIKKETN